MAISEGSRVYFAYKKEATANTEETGSGGKILRRATGTLDLTKPEVTSAEKRDDFQEVSVNHGTRNPSWQIQSELFGGDYEEFLAATLRKDFAGISTINAGASDAFTISSGVMTRGAGGGQSFITGGLYKGLIGRLSNMAGTANNSRNLRLTSVTATTVGLLAVDGGAAVANDAGSNTSAQLSIPGQVSYIPSSSHTSDTFTIERYDRELDVSEVAYGCKVGTFEMNVQPDQPVQITFGGIGIDRKMYGTSSAPSLTSPTAAGTGAALSAAIGVLRVNSVAYAVITGITLSVDLGLSNRAVVFGNKSPNVFYGRTASVTGTINTMRISQALQTIYDEETEVSIELFLEAPGSAPRAFFNVYMDRVKLIGEQQDDPDGPVAQTFNFRALKPTSGATGVQQTTILIQDSSIS